MQEQEEIPQERVIYNSQAVTNIAKNQKNESRNNYHEMNNVTDTKRMTHTDEKENNFIEVISDAPKKNISIEFQLHHSPIKDNRFM